MKRSLDSHGGNWRRLRQLPVFRMVITMMVSLILCFGGNGAVAAGTSPSSSLEGRWSEVSSNDLPQYAAKLRRAGFPEDVVRLLLSHELEIRFLQREQALYPASLSADALRSSWSPERRLELLLLQKEKREISRAVFGIVPEPSSEADWVLEKYPQLTADERETIRLITEQYEEMMSQIKQTAGGYLTAAEGEALAFLERERSHDLSIVLDVDKLLEFELEHTALGSYVSRLLELFRPRPDELRTFYGLAVGRGLSELAAGGLSRERAIQMRDFVRQIIDELQAQWPEDRASRLERSTSQQYRRIHYVVQRFGLPSHYTDDVFASLKRCMDKVEALMESAATSGQRYPAPQEVLAIYETHRAEVEQILGPKGLAMYLEVNDHSMSALAKGEAVIVSLAF